MVWTCFKKGSEGLGENAWIMEWRA